MSGHSKWAKIKRQKGGADSKRGVVFGKISKEITIAVRDGGGDPEMNFKLRLAIDRARGVNMPKDTIERAIKKGTGELSGGNIEELFYEAYGPGAIPFIIQVLTDNKNRSVAEIRHVFTKNGGTFGASVIWMFERLGVMRSKQTETGNYDNNDKDEIELNIIDAGAIDIKEDDDGLIIYTKASELQKVKEALDNKKFDIEYAEIEYVPKEQGTFSEQDKSKLIKIIEFLEEHDDVANFYTNIDL